MVDRRIKAARFPTVKMLDSFDFEALACLNKVLVIELARSKYIDRRENIIALGNSGTGKSYIVLRLGLAAYQSKGGRAPEKMMRKRMKARARAFIRSPVMQNLSSPPMQNL